MKCSTRWSCQHGNGLARVLGSLVKIRQISEIRRVRWRPTQKSGVCTCDVDALPGQVIPQQSGRVDDAPIKWSSRKRCSELRERTVRIELVAEVELHLERPPRLCEHLRRERLLRRRGKARLGALGRRRLRRGEEFGGAGAALRRRPDALEVV